MTIAAFGDMGYQVNYSADDPYTWPAPPPGAALMASTRVMEMKNDVRQGPILVVDDAGRVVQVIRP